MFRFVHADMLWCLIAIPVIIIAYIIHTIYKRRQLKRFGNPQLIKELMPDASKSRPIIQFCLLMAALALLIIAAARPQYSQSKQKIKREGMEVMVALDISNSMLAEDVQPNRLERAKQMLSKMIDDTKNNNIGLVVFAGESFLHMPITYDFASAKMFLSTITPELISMQGTAIGAALKTSMDAFGESERNVGRAIIIITDGENHEDDAIAAAQKAQEEGIKVFVIGIGTPEGSPIPTGGQNEFLKDRSGQIVISHLNESMCQEIANAGKGIYVRCDNTNSAMRTLEKELSRMATEELETIVFNAQDEQYQSFVMAALILLIIAIFILPRKNHRLARMDLFKEKNNK